MFLKNKSLTDVFYVAILQGTNILIPVIITPYLLSVLGPGNYGIFSYALAVVQYYILFVDFGFNITATQRISVMRHNPGVVSETFFGIIFIKLLLTVLCWIINISIVLNLPNVGIYKDSIDIMFLMVLGNALFPMWLFQGLGKIKMLTIINLISKACVFPLMFFFIKTSDQFLLAAKFQAYIYFYSSILSYILIFRYKLIKFKLFIPTFDYIRKAVSESFPIFLANVSVSVYTTLFIIILGIFATSDKVGYYSAAEKIIRAICVLIYIPVNQVFFSRISFETTHNIDNAKRLFKKLYNIMLITMSVISIMLFLFSTPIVQLLGKSYAQASVLLKILSPVPLFITLGGVCGQLGLLPFGFKTFYQKAYLQASILAVIVVFILTYFFKETGTAVSLLLTEIIVFYLMYKKVKATKIMA